jgi:hypothetical protein
MSLPVSIPFTLTALCPVSASRFLAWLLRSLAEMLFWSLRVLLSPEKSHSSALIALGVFSCFLSGKQSPAKLAPLFLEMDDPL